MDNLRIVQFPEAGEGVELFFRNSDMRKLQEFWGPTYNETINEGLTGLNVKVIDKCLEIGSKLDGKPHKVNFDDLDDLPIEVLGMRLLDAYTLSVTGRTYIDNLKWVREEMKKLGDNPSPPLLSPEASSARSEELPSGPGSDQPSSGT